MKKTLKLGFGGRFQTNSNLFSIFVLIRLILSYILKIRLLACLILQIAVKKTLKLDLEDDLNFFEDCFRIPLTRHMNVKKQV